jgi:hypothetical protein
LDNFSIERSSRQGAAYVQDEIKLRRADTHEFVWEAYAARPDRRDSRSAHALTDNPAVPRGMYAVGRRFLDPATGKTKGEIIRSFVVQDPS